MMSVIKFGLVLILATLMRCEPVPRSGTNPDSFSPRNERDLPHLLDPFGLLDMAGKAVVGMGRRLEAGANHVTKIVGDSAASFDSAVKQHLENVHSGVQEAGKVVSIVSEDILDSVSSLVREQLLARPDPIPLEVIQGEQESMPNSLMSREGLVDGVLKMVGVDQNQIGMMALNALIFMAEMIVSYLTGNESNQMPQTRSGDAMSIVSRIIQGDPQKLDFFLKEAQDPALPRRIIERLVGTTGDDSACVQLLVCKMSPVVWGLQKSVKRPEEGRAKDPDVQDKGLMQSIYDSLPELTDFMRFSTSCEKQFPSCPMLNLADLGL